MDPNQLIRMIDYYRKNKMKVKFVNKVKVILLQAAQKETT